MKVGFVERVDVIVHGEGVVMVLSKVYRTQAQDLLLEDVDVDTKKVIIFRSLFL